MKLFIGILFVISVLLFTFFSKGCGDYNNRLEAKLQENWEAKEQEIGSVTRGKVTLEKVQSYDTILSGTVGEGEKGDVQKLIADSSFAGRGRVQGLEEGQVGPSISEVEVLPSELADAEKAAVLGALGVAAGAGYDAANLPAYTANLKELPGIADASVTSEQAGNDFKLIASVTPEPPAITKVNVVPNGEGEVDTAAVTQALGLNIGDAYDPSGFAAAGKRVSDLPGIASADLSGTEVEGGYEVTATVVPVKPMPNVVSSFKVEPLAGSTLPEGDLIGIAGVEIGDPFSAGVPGEIAGKLIALDTVKNAEIKSTQTHDGYHLVAVVTPAQQQVVSSLEVIPVDGSTIDRDLAMKAAGVSKGDAFTPAMIGDLERKFTALDGIASANVTAEETVEGFKLVARLAEAKAAPAPEAPVELADALKDINVYFATNSTEVSEVDFKKLVRAAGAIVNAGNQNPVAVTGFADPRGNVEYNQALSLRRANAVCDILVSNGVKRSLLTPDGAGVPGEESLDEQRRVEVRPSNRKVNN